MCTLFRTYKHSLPRERYEELATTSLTILMGLCYTKDVAEGYLMRAECLIWQVCRGPWYQHYELESAT